jgi:hypothetical protein
MFSLRNPTVLIVSNGRPTQIQSWYDVVCQLYNEIVTSLYNSTCSILDSRITIQLPKIFERIKYNFRNFTELK